jgi:hypothetical protein
MASVGTVNVSSVRITSATAYPLLRAEIARLGQRGRAGGRAGGIQRGWEGGGGEREEGRETRESVCECACFFFNEP